jgi:hypothetical protein
LFGNELLEPNEYRESAKCALKLGGATGEKYGCIYVLGRAACGDTFEVETE